MSLKLMVKFLSSFNPLTWYILDSSLLRMKVFTYLDRGELPIYSPESGVYISAYVWRRAPCPSERRGQYSWYCPASAHPPLDMEPHQFQLGSWEARVAMTGYQPATCSAADAGRAVT